MHRLIPIIILATVIVAGCGYPKNGSPSRANRYLVYWAPGGGSLYGCLETNSYTVHDGMISFHIEGYRTAIYLEKPGMDITLTRPWAVVDTQAGTANVPAEVPR